MNSATPYAAGTIEDALRVALSLLGPNGSHWIKHAARAVTPDGMCYCTAAALEKVRPIVGRARYVTLCQSFLAAQDWPDFTDVEAWNDDPCRTFYDVAVAFQNAIRYAHERGL